MFGGGDCDACLYALCSNTRSIFVMLANLKKKTPNYLPTRNLHSVTFYISNEAHHCSKQYFVEWDGMELKWKPIGNLIEGCQFRKLNGWWRQTHPILHFQLFSFGLLPKFLHIDQISIYSLLPWYFYCSFSFTLNWYLT